MGTEDGTPRVPAFLLQSKIEIHQQFEELEWRQRLRIAEANSSPETSRWVIEHDLEVLQRNRYANVQPWKHSRIHLKVPQGRSDYINASPITVKDSTNEQETKYIATQGPKDNQFNLFWQMVWETTGDVAVIVMLTQTTEAGRDKCAMYYPPDMERDTLVVEDKDPFTDHAPATVKLLEINYDEEAHSMIRKLELTFEGQTKTVWHMLYTNWPDFGVPEGANSGGLLKLIMLSASKNTSPENPRIIHCSAGVGRSGTFIALDHLLRELSSSNCWENSKGSDPVLDTVNMLREQRMMMVQSEIQYQFIYSFLKDQIEEKPESNGHTPTLVINTTIEGTSDEVEQRSPKVAKLTGDLDSEISSANSLLLSEKTSMVTPVITDVEELAKDKVTNELDTPPPDAVEIKL